MRGALAHIGLGPSLAEPLSITPETTVVELCPGTVPSTTDEAAAAQAIRAAIARSAGAPIELVDDVHVGFSALGTVLVCMPQGGVSHRALSVAARRRHSNVAEALHAVIEGCGVHQATP